ncbi:hypothetical protein [Arthrobacter sp. zg-Y769]|uniref:hypothetical protein n=1 Tax=Arthrobacter sp. zg-Y769 TaxID=2894191 RepID=UPI001E412AC6|nr:hypothetical protein [Arthrobacter sp. zg-Y769]MCC9205524.1 hypothetical protein [Arthrobacter sp. zg-Y769]
MSEHLDEQDRLYVRGLLAESGVEETPELVEELLALRSESRAPAPEPVGELAALLAGTPVPLRPRARGGRGIILGAALIGAMAVGAGGVAAYPDFLVRADPAPEVTFTPEAPTLDRAEPAGPKETAEPVLPAAVTAPEPAPVVEAVPVPAPAPEPAPAPTPAPAVVPAPPAVPDNQHEARPGPGDDGTRRDHAGPGGQTGFGPHTGYVPNENRRSDGLVRDTMGPGAGAAAYGGQVSSRDSNGRGTGWGTGGGNSLGRDPSGRDR